jgi:Uma2 family endonuclease
VFWYYKAHTPGVELLDNATTILDAQAEPQPDVSLRILTEYGGQTRLNERRVVVGPPELVVEVVDSRPDVALGDKRDDYERTGVIEYVVVNLNDGEIRWFDLQAGNVIRPRQGVYRSRVFPGLWVNGPAVLAGDAAAQLATAQQGIANPGHTRFVRRLERARRQRAGEG